MKFLEVVVLMSVVAVLPDRAHSIVCYQCNSAYDPRCGDPFDPYSLGTINCSMKIPLDHMPTVEPSICRKNVQKVYGKTRIVRECGYLSDVKRDDKMCLRRSGTHDVIIHYCSCTGDLCNSGKSLLPPGITVFALATLLAMMAGKRTVTLNDDYDL